MTTQISPGLKYVGAWTTKVFGKLEMKSLIATRLAIVLFLCLVGTANAQQTRVLGLDVSTYQGELAETNWATIQRATNEVVDGVYGDGRDFVFIRATRGGTTGEDHRQGGYPSGNNTYFTLSERYDDPYFVQNITRATAAGLLAGPYHFGRADVVATTTNTGGIANTGTDEANHFFEMAGAWMRPGYLLPVFDLEAGNNRTAAQLATFCIDFSDRIYQLAGIRPIMYINGGYSTYLQGIATPTNLVTAFPKLWDARYAINDDPTSTAYWTGHPKDTFSGFYGPWDDSPFATNPWSFWQYASSAGRLNGYKNGTTAIDLNVAQGGFEFLADHLVPALWMRDTNGDWSTMTNWNSGIAPVAPVQSSGQLTPIGTQVLPTVRLPSLNDHVILDRPNANVTITLTNGTQIIRKLTVRETLNISGGTLLVTYSPSWDSTTNSAEFSGAVTLSGTGSFRTHTLDVDPASTFSLNGGTLTMNTIRLMPDAVSPAKISMGGNVTFGAVAGTNATIANGPGSGAGGFITLNGGSRIFTVNLGINLLVDVPLTNGALYKSGPGTMWLNTSNLHNAGTVIAAGTLLVNNTNGSGTGTGSVTVASGVLGGTGIIAGPVIVQSGGMISPGPVSGIGTLTLNTNPSFAGTNFMHINRNGGSSLADRIVLTSGTMTYGGTLVVSNVGAALVGGEVFTNFSAPSYSGSFAATNLPPLSAGLNWYLGGLVANGSIKVNRSPLAAAVTVTNVFPSVLKIPFASLVGTGSDADGDAIALGSFDLVTTNGVSLSISNSFIIYSNSVNVADRFNFTLSDGHGGSATANVQIVPTLVGQFTSNPIVSSNSVTLQLVGRPGSVYYVERSTNLPAFLTISTNTAPANGLYNFTDNFLNLGGQRPAAAYYRLRW